MDGNWTVTELNRYIRTVFDSDYRLQGVWVTGEVSNLSRPASGHLYFTLKDSGAALRCVIWRNQALRLTYLPRDGDAIEAHGNVSVYETGGQYQLYADRLRPAGEGLLYREFLALKDKLEAEGLFAEERKRPLPGWPRLIGLVTSPTGAALRDMLHVIARRFPLAQVILSPTPVQGEEAPAKIVAALEAVDSLRPDVILLARGGGSIEDLWAFNDEGVARAIAASLAPVVTGVGHETDFTIADFVADRRAPTPSAAAELVTPDRAELRDAMRSLAAQMAQGLVGRLQEGRWALAEQAAILRGLSPRAQVANARQRLDELAARAASSLTYRVGLRRARLTGVLGALSVVGPQATLARGFAVVTRAADGRVVHSTGEVKPGDKLEIRVGDGTFGATVDRS